MTPLPRNHAALSTKHYSATHEFIGLLMTKIACLEEYGSKTRWKVGESGNADTQWKAGEIGSKATQWKAGESGSKATQWKAGESGSKETQWVSCGRFGAKGNAETYASMRALEKAIGRRSSYSSMSQALWHSKKKTPSSALRVDFKFAGLELYWDKEIGVGELA